MHRRRWTDCSKREITHLNEQHEQHGHQRALLLGRMRQRGQQQLQRLRHRLQACRAFRPQGCRARLPLQTGNRKPMHQMSAVAGRF